MSQQLKSLSLVEGSLLHVASHLPPRDTVYIGPSDMKELVWLSRGHLCGTLFWDPPSVISYWRNWLWKEDWLGFGKGRYDSCFQIFEGLLKCSRWGARFWSLIMALLTSVFVCFHLNSFQPKIILWILWFSKWSRQWLCWLNLDSWGRLSGIILAFWAQPLVNWSCNSYIYYTQNWMSY